VAEEIFQVARSLPAGLVDVIVAGHTHQPIGHQVAATAITEAYSGGRAFGRVDLLLDRGTKKILERRSFPPVDLCARVDPGTNHCDPGGARAARVPAEYEGAPVTPDPRIVRDLEPGVLAAAARKTESLGVTLATPVRRLPGQNESPLGNFFADAYLAAMPDADVVVNNTEGGLRADLPAGPLTFGEVFEVMPFDNRLLGFRLTGAEFRRMVATWMRERFPATPGLAGLRVRVACRGTTLDITLLRPNGTPVKDDDRLLVAATDFLADGGDRLFTSVTPPGGFVIEREAGAVRDIAAEAFRKRGGTLREDQLVDAANPRWVLPGPRPVMCGK
jgi:5'-nucleotidase